MSDPQRHPSEVSLPLINGGEGTPGAQELAENPPPAPSEAELQELREALSSQKGADYWEKLEELSTTGPFQAFLRRWFPSQAARFGPDADRRGFLRSMGASLATLGLGACTRQPTEKILPYANRPELIIPGKPRYFATAFPHQGRALGVLVESHMNRPTKVEGNPEHPSSLGATDAQAQASILGLYDPDRSHSVMRAGQISTWDTFLTDLRTRIDGYEASGGKGLALLVEQTSSPTLQRQLAALRETYPAVAIHHWSPLHRDASREGALRTFGRDVEQRIAYDRASVVVSLDHDFLGSGPASVRSSRDFVQGRRGRREADSMNRLYVVESTLSVTGGMADNRLALTPSGVERFARVLAEELGVLSAPARPLNAGEQEVALARAAARDLSAHAGASAIVVGESQPPAVHALAHAMNHALRNHGQTIELIEPLEPWTESAVESIQGLVRAMRAGEVETLLMLGGNPVYDAPCELDFRQALREVEHRIHLSSHVDETSGLCHWHLPLAHYLESWSDLRSPDGTATIVQPLIAPLYGAHTVHDLIAALTGNTTPSSYELVRETWMAASGLEGDAFEDWWKTVLHDGSVPDTRAAALALEPTGEASFGEFVPVSGLELTFRADAAVLDGRYGNNGWLQEMPRPMTRLTWDNAALVSKATADEQGLESGDLVRVVSGDRSIEAAVWVTSGHPDGTITLHLGYGRTAGGALAKGVGFDAYRLRTSYAGWNASEVKLERTGDSYMLASVQDHPSMEGRDLVRVTTFDRFQADPEHATAPHHSVPVDELSLYEGYKYDGYAWGMVIDLNACIGCNACMIACQSENNIPIVGKEEVEKGREMHWLRIDRYFEEKPEGWSVLHQPVPCMHCEQAPCEVVCPVAATVHSDEGLNDMVYNRCVGTRYCSNNCPYKVRHFNFFGYSDYETESLKLANNPDVTVRTRGVMEKCTYCVQRISAARITAKKEDRTIRDGEAVSACMQVCPTQAITFGDINDEESRVAKLRQEPHHYALLEELGTRPRTTYLAKFTNPNPDLGAS